MVLKNGPSIEIRFTDIHNKRTSFYFDRMFIVGDSVTGRPSRMLQSLSQTIALHTIKLIEIQDGRKRYKYINQ